ncbi:MAG: sulfate permease [Bradymonadaceae bacterium]
MESLSKIFPAAEWLADYDTPDLQGDLSAGLTVGVMLIPQSMAYAMLAGMPPIYGLYAGLLPLLIYAVLGTSRHMAVGPVAVDMIIAGAGVGAVAGSQTQHIEFVVLVVAMTGLIEIALAIMRFGFMVNFLSRPVIAGFMTAAPLIIAASQLGNLMGVDLSDAGAVHMEIWMAFQRIGEANPWAFGIGLFGIVFLLVLQNWKPKLPAALLWVVLATVVAWGVGLGQSAYGVDLVGQVPEGLPPFELQSWSWEAVQKLLPTAITLALVQFMTVMSLGQAFAAEHDYDVDANRELFAVGLGNFVGSFTKIVPASGSFSRSAVNNRAGANTPMANVVAAIAVGLTLLFLTPLFQFLPISALAAIIMVACIGMIDVPELRYLLKTRWMDGAVALLTFGATLIIGIQEGILIGIGASIVVVLWDLTQPNVVELGHVPGTQEFRDVARNPEAESISDIHIIRIDSRFSFANAKLLKEQLIEEAEADSVRALIIDTSGVNDLDTTATQALTEVIEEFAERDIDFYVVGAKGPVRDVMRRSGLQELIGEANFYLNTHLAVTDILERWNEETEYGPTEQPEGRREREEIDEMRDRIEEERESMDQERARLEREIAEHEEARDRIDVERDQLRQRLEEAQKRRDQLREEREQAEVSHEELEARQEKLEEQEEKLEERREQIEAQQEKLEARQQELEEEREDIQDDRQTVIAERERLKSEIEAHLAEQREIADTRNQLKEELRRAENQREQLMSEREKMREQQEELRAERKRLEAERRKAAPDADDRESSDGESETGESAASDESDDADESGSEHRNAQTDPNKEFDQPV